MASGKHCCLWLKVEGNMANSKNSYILTTECLWGNPFTFQVQSFLCQNPYRILATHKHIQWSNCTSTILSCKYALPFATLASVQNAGGAYTGM